MTPAMAAARALLAERSSARACARLEASGDTGAARFLAGHREVERLLPLLPDHEASLDVAALALTFDRLVAASPEAAVAFYSLGDPALLAAATQEVVDALRGWCLIGDDRRVIEIGCGIGRFLSATGAVGIDISWGMLKEARRRLPAAALAQTAGRDIPIGDGGLDTVLAIDSFPYIVQAGLAEAQLAEAARVLKPGGELVIFNYAYGDESGLPALASAHGFHVVLGGERLLRLWDASCWRLRADPRRAVSEGPAGRCPA
jgi:SAM-dependent methyltransferase